MSAVVWTKSSVDRVHDELVADGLIAKGVMY